uniref:uncharacterized protein LOC117605346 n=1 Tax=Osmia lignaria TaxID=473952 RepID=UPI0014782719|nr:uncharacterized protein LOC117605346 [Osmia lignaria]
MFQWIKRSSSKKIRQHLPKHHRISFIIKKGVSTVSFSSTTALETSLNYDFKESFAKKSFQISKKTKQISRRLISKFQRKTKDVSVNKKKNQSMDNLINDSMDKIEDSFVNEEETKFIVDGNLNEKVSIVKEKEVSLKKKSSDNCDKKKQQISHSNWEVIVNEENPLTTPSALIKIEDRTEVSSEVKSNRVIVRRKPTLISFEDSGNSSAEISPCADDKSFFSDSAICVTGNYSSTDETDVADKLRDLKFDCSFDCVKSCDKYTCNCEEGKCFGEVPGKIFSRSVLNNPENRVSSYMKFPLKSAERLAGEVTDGSGKCNSNEFEQVKNFIQGNEWPRLIEENCWRRNRFGVSKSSDDLHNEDLTCSFNDVAEFSSLNDFPCTGLRVDVDENRDENDESNEDTEVQEVSLQFDYEYDEESSSVDSYNVSYVISMYV